MPKHWMDRSNRTCHVCGKVSRTMLEEARHRHNFPALCKRNKKGELTQPPGRGVKVEKEIEQ